MGQSAPLRLFAIPVGIGSFLGGELPFPISPAYDAHGLIADPHASVARIAANAAGRGHHSGIPACRNASATRAYKSVWLFD